MRTNGLEVSRRHLLELAGLTLLTAPLASRAAPGPLLEVWKSPTCGCCNQWIAQMQAAGYAVRAVDIGNVAVRKGLGMPEKYGSCHTARIEGYLLEGHVPPREIQRMLTERPVALGLAVPGMPVGSPGMDGPAYKARRDPYDVLLVQRDGTAGVYQAYR